MNNNNNNNNNSNSNKGSRNTRSGTRSSTRSVRLTKNLYKMNVCIEKNLIKIHLNTTQKFSNCASIIWMFNDILTIKEMKLTKNINDNLSISKYDTSKLLLAKQQMINGNISTSDYSSNDESTGTPSNSKLSLILYNPSPNGSPNTNTNNTNNTKNGNTDWNSNFKTFKNNNRFRPKLSKYHSNRELTLRKNNSNNKAKIKTKRGHIKRKSVDMNINIINTNDTNFHNLNNIDENTPITVEFVSCIEVTHCDNNEKLLLYFESMYVVTAL